MNSITEFQRFIQALLIMSLFWKRIEFHQGESDHEAIIITAGGLGGGHSEPPPAGRFFHFVAPSFPLNFSSSLETLSSAYFYLKWDTEVKKKSLKFEQQNELLLKGALKTFRACGAYFLRDFAIHEYKSLPQAENF